MASDALRKWSSFTGSRSPQSLRLPFASAFLPTPLSANGFKCNSPHDCRPKVGRVLVICQSKRTSYSTPRLPGTPLSTRTPAWVRPLKRTYSQNSTPQGLLFKCEARMLWAEREKGTSTDVLLDPGTGKKIAAHRTLLMFTSPVFQKHLAIDVPVGKQLVIKMYDFSERVILQFLEYLYLQELHEEVMKDTAVQLWGMAHKFMVPELKELVEEMVQSCLTVDNVICNTMRAEDHNARPITEECLRFIVENKKMLGDRSDFQILPNHLKLQLLEKLIQE